MARAIWSGAVTFGLVNVPVKLFTATQSHKIPFHQYDRKSGQRIRYKRVAEETGEEVAWEDIIKGAEVEGGQYVLIRPEELEAVEPVKSRTIQVEAFVDLAQIDPITWNKTYYLGPEVDVGAERPYLLLRQAMENTGKVAIARFVMRTKEYLATVRPLGRMLALETMYFADEVRSPEVVENLPKELKLAPKEVAMAEQLIESLSEPWKHSAYRDRYRKQVEELIEKKKRGDELKLEAPKESAPVVDLMQALEASLRSVQQKGKEARHRDGDGEELATLTKSELYRRATEADISGRSSMSKDELVHALEEATS